MPINTDDEIVWVSTGSRQQKYHDDADCDVIGANVRERRKAVLESWDGWTPCERCHDEFENPDCKGGRQSGGRQLAYELLDMGKEADGESDV